jgi:hypothetical protein
MLVFKLNVEEADGGFEVTCPDDPAIRYTISSLWDACTLRDRLAEREGVPEDLVWLQVRARTAGITVISDVHPLHWVSFHSVVQPAHPVFNRSKLLFNHALTALRHEADQAADQGRIHTQVKFIVSFLDGTRSALPRYGGFKLLSIIDDTRHTEDLGAWIRARVSGFASAEPHWSSPITALQIGIFGPDTPAPRRFR